MPYDRLAAKLKRDSELLTIYNAGWNAAMKESAAIVERWNTPPAMRGLVDDIKPREIKIVGEILAAVAADMAR